MDEHIIMTVLRLSEEAIIDDLQSSIFNWQINKNEDNFKNIIVQTHMLQIKVIVGDDVQKALKLIEDVDRIKRLGLDEK
jgi:hypothetical protein